MTTKEEIRKELYQVKMALVLERESLKKMELEKEAKELHAKLSKAILEEKLKGRGK